MSNRSNTAQARARLHERRPRACAWALVIMLMSWTGAPGAARADAIILQNGEWIDGSIIDATRNTVIVRRAMGGIRQMPIQDVAEVRLDLAEGDPISGQLVGWDDAVHEVRSGGEVVRISAGRILTRERRDQATTPPPGLPPRPLAPRPGERPTVTAATAPQVGRAERERQAGERSTVTAAPEVGRAELERQAGEAEAAPPRNRAAAISATSMARAEDSLAVAAPTHVDPPRTAAAPGAATPVAHPADAAGLADINPAKVSKGAVAPAAVTASEISPAVVTPAGASAAEADSAKTAAAEVSATEVGASGATSRPEAAGDDQRLAVKGTVESAEAGTDGIVFRIELSRPAEQPVVLIYGTVDGTAKAGKDYEAQQGVVTLTPGSRSADVRVPLLEHSHPGNAGFELFLIADPKVANVIDQRIAATIPAAD